MVPAALKREIEEMCEIQRLKVPWPLHSQ
jgi:hypothetical protein